MLKENVDCLVLGCTHYPYLIPQIKEIVGHAIHIIDSGAAVAKQTKMVLEKNNLKSLQQKKMKHQLYTNTSEATLETLLLAYKEIISINELDF